MIRQFLKRLGVSKHIEYKGVNGFCDISQDSAFEFENGSKIILHDGARFLFGYDRPGRPSSPSFCRSLILLEENATIEVKGDVGIGAGSSVRVKKSGRIIFEGDNLLGNNNTILIHGTCHFGKKASTSWGVSIIDFDGHSYVKDGKPLRRIVKPISIGSAVGIQMNVSILGGVIIGDNSVIAAHTVLTKDVPSNALVYQERNLVIKSGITSGL